MLQSVAGEPVSNTLPATQSRPQTTTPVRGRIATFVVTIQLVLFLAHWFVYQTWMTFRGDPDPPGTTALQIGLLLLSVSFVAASLLAFRYYNFFVRLFYKIAATWLGFFNFFFVAALASWSVYVGALIFRLPISRPSMVEVLFGLAFLAGTYGVLNARSIRVRRLTVKLSNLPSAWRGRTAALVSDIHLGHINGARFLRGIVSRVAQLQPDIVFITGDLYDGSKVDPDSIAAPLRELSSKFGAYFVTGNHEEFSDPSKYLDAIERAGVGVLHNEKIVIKGLQIVGVSHADSTTPYRLRSVLEHADVDRNQASILLSHSPHGLPIVEQSGIALQLSGHTHGGQVFPFTWFTRRIFGDYTYGLNRFGELMVYTSTGVGTWGPPMRVGTRSEIVLIQFQ